jgi:hypothetical protein
MEAEKIFDYVDDNSQETGLNIGLVFEKTSSEEVENDFLPESLETESSVKRIATYVDWYTELAWLFIEDGGIGFERMKEIFDALKDEGLLPYEFREIVRRHDKQIEVVELEEGFKVIDRKDGKYFYTESTDNPMNLPDKNNTGGEEN